MPYREQSSLPSKGESEVVPRKPYSPFQQFDGKADFAMARFDDLVNWARKVILWRILILANKQSLYFVFYLISNL